MLERVARVRRFQMQDTAAKWANYYTGRDNRSRPDRVAYCLRRLTSVASGVELRYDPVSHSGFYRGLQTCGSVWHCPVCAAKITEKRRGQLARLIDAHIAAGGSVWMTTYTVSHHRATDLDGLLDGFLAARRKMRQGRRGMALRSDFGVVGTVSVLEVTQSPRNGWHPHVHELVLSSDPNMDPDAYDRAVRPAWEDAAAGQGLTMNAHGFRIDRTFGAVQDYIAKFGHEPACAKTWGVESEMVKGHIKQARDEDGMTPFAMLAAITDGLKQYVPLWQEYCRVFKGRKQLTWSPGLKQRYGIEDEPDADLAAQADEQSGEPAGAPAPVTLVNLSPAQWDQALEANVRCDLVELTRSGRPGMLVAGLAEHGINVSPPDMAGWRVRTPGGDGEMVKVAPGETAPGGWWAYVFLDGPPGDRNRFQLYALWNVEVLSDGAQEREALLREADAARESGPSGTGLARRPFKTARVLHSRHGQAGREEKAATA